MSMLVYNILGFPSGTCLYKLYDSDATLIVVGNFQIAGSSNNRTRCMWGGPFSFGVLSCDV